MSKLINIDYVVDKTHAKSINPQVLAFIGDSVYALYMKTYVVKNFADKANNLNTLTNNLVKATRQSDVVGNLLDVFNDEELAVYKRARNYKTANTAKHASVMEYHRATGLEAVIGYLYLTDQIDRLNDILNICVGDNNEDRR